VTIASLRYKVYDKPHLTRASVIIPVVDEDTEIFSEVLESICDQYPYQVVVVANGPYSRDIREACNNFADIDYHYTKKPGKRNAIKLGMQYVDGEIIVLVDSDTIWQKNTLSELMKPFGDNQVGGVTTRQKIINPNSNLRNRLCDWLEDVRFYGAMQAMSASGKVGCLPGRTIAFRKEIIASNMDEFLNETFLGFHKEVSDDRSLTNLTLKAGYKTVLQASSVVYTSAPDSWRKYLRQQLRWAEGSQYNNIKMSGWMFKNAKPMFLIYWIDTLIPFMLWGLIISFFINLLFFPEHLHQEVLFKMHASYTIIAMAAIGAYLSYGLRQIPTISENKTHLLYLPFYLLFLSLIMSPLRILGFAKLADDLAWGTRNVDSKIHLRIVFEGAAYDNA
jgi:hyaluronan synthase